MTLQTSAWFDLVYHVLACVPVGTDDASNLFRSDYRRWVDAALTTPGRTLPEDAKTLAVLYRRAEQAHQLHGFPLLYDTLEQFSPRVRTEFGALDWPTEERAALARQLTRQLPAELLELFRIALWSEARSGYLELRQRVIEPTYTRAGAELEREIHRLGQLVPGIAALPWLICHPLRRHGRLLWRGGKPLVVTGVPTQRFSVSLGAPLMQGLHEFVLLAVKSTANSRPATTRAGSAHYLGHLGPEFAALTLTAQLISGSAFEETHREWLEHLFPRGCNSLPDLPWSGEHPDDSRVGPLVERLRSGELAPPALRDTLPDRLNGLRQG